MLRKLNRKNQSGITFIGFLIVCSLLIFFAFLGMRLWPILNEKIKVDQAMENLKTREDVATLSRNGLGKYMLRHFEVEDVDQFERMADLKDIFIVQKIKGKKKRLMQMVYEIRRPVVDGKFDVVYKYNKSLVIDGTGE